MKDYTVTGCIVTHNNMRTIADTVETLLRETKGVDFHLYVVDNMSTDGTPEFIIKNYPQVEVIATGTNRGFGAGHNVVRDRLTSRYHVIINPDIVLTEDAITKMAEYMDENENVGMVSPKIVFPDGRPQILGKRNPSLKYLFASRLRKGDKPSALLREYAMLDEDLSVPCKIENASGCFMAIRSELFQKLGGFDEKFFMYFEDCDLTRRVNVCSQTIFLPGACVQHVWGRESKKNGKLRRIQIQSMFHYFFKWKLGEGKKEERRALANG